MDSIKEWCVPTLGLKIIDNDEKMKIKVCNIGGTFPMFTLYKYEELCTFPVECTILGLRATYNLDDEHKSELKEILALLDIINEVGYQSEPY
jgi:hypothetical protein